MTHRRFEARYVTAEEAARLREYNGAVVEQVWPEGKVIGYFSPMNFADRVAAALNIAERFSNDELRAISNGIKEP